MPEPIVRNGYVQEPTSASRSNVSSQFIDESSELMVIYLLLSIFSFISLFYFRWILLNLLLMKVKINIFQLQP